MIAVTGAVAVASGQAALHLVLATIVTLGDHIVASRSLYGGTQLIRLHVKKILVSDKFC